jgi:Domain of unknown function (DUF4349)
MGDWLENGIDWRKPLVVLLVAVVVGLVALATLGTQTSRILSTVGARVPDEGTVRAAPLPPSIDFGNGEPAADSVESGAGEPASANLLDAARPDLLIIKTGEISIQAAAIGPVVEKVTNQLVALGGYASGSTRSGTGEKASATITFRVPARQWETALAVARGAGDEVLDEHTETVDVTGDVVDLKARIRNLQATEAAFQAIMTRATAIKDILSVQSELTEVRGQIEQLSSKAADLERRAAYSTLTVNVRPRAAPVIARQQARFDPGHEAEGATARLVAILQHVATIGIWVGIVWLPVLAAFSLIGGIAFVIFRRARRVFGGDSGGATPVPEGGA